MCGGGRGLVVPLMIVVATEATGGRGQRAARVEE